MSVYEHHSEVELLDALRQGDQAAFDEIYRRYWSGMFRSAYSILQNRDASMDILQDVFIWLWQHREQVRIQTSLKSYLSVSVYYKAANYIRQGKVREAFFEELKIAQIEYSEEDPLELKELKALIKQYTDQFPEKRRKIYRLSRDEHLSNKEIAQRLGISIKTVENQMTIALRKLRTSLKKLAIWLIFFM